jgi:L-2-hydroxyglutarate oxidase LhgO
LLLNPGAFCVILFSVKKDAVKRPFSALQARIITTSTKQEAIYENCHHRRRGRRRQLRGTTRRLDEKAEIVVLERGEYVSFANCGLPYHIGGEIKSRDALILQTPEAMRKKYNIDVRVKSEVTSIDRAAKTVTVRRADTGETYTESYDALVISTGSSP